MGWNGGGFGHMTFETPEGVAAWKAASVVHDQWDDWADWFAKAVSPRFVVGAQLTELRALHDPEGRGYLAIDEHGPTIDFALDTGEDTVRAFSGTIAATLRAAAEHGARGTFYFLGTAGAEQEFTYKLELANGFSTMETLNQREIAMVYESDAYQAFSQRVMDALGVVAPDPDEVERAALKQKAAAFVEASKPRAAAASTLDAEESVEPKPARKQPAVKRKPAARKQPAKKPPAAKAKQAKKPAAKAKKAKKPKAKKPAAKAKKAKPAAKTTKAKK